MARDLARALVCVLTEHACPRGQENYLKVEPEAPVLQVIEIQLGEVIQTVVQIADAPQIQQQRGALLARLKVGSAALGRADLVLALRRSTDGSG